MSAIGDSPPRRGDERVGRFAREEAQVRPPQGLGLKWLVVKDHAMPGVYYGEWQRMQKLLVAHMPIRTQRDALDAAQEISRIRREGSKECINMHEALAMSEEWLLPPIYRGPDPLPDPLAELLPGDNILTALASTRRELCFPSCGP